MNFLTLDLNLLRLLDAMLRERSTTRAAERVGLSQPAVSAALRRLRAALADPLFVRMGNAMVPTPFAESLEVPLRQSLGALEAMLSEARAFDPARMERSFRLFGADYLNETLLPALADRLGRMAPGTRLHLMHQDPGYVVAHLSDGRLDMALMPDFDAPPWVARAEAFRPGARVVARRGHQSLVGIAEGEAMPLEAFCALGHVAFAPDGAASNKEDEALARLGCRRRVVLTVPQFYAVGRIAAQTGLIGVLPARFAEAVAPGFGLACYLLPYDRPPPSVRLFWHARNTGSPEHRWMREQVLDILAAAETPAAGRHRA